MRNLVGNTSIRYRAMMQSCSTLFSALLQEFGHQTGPARLMIRADTGSIVAVEVLVKQNQIAPMWIVLVPWIVAMHGPMPVLGAQKDSGQPSRNFRRNLPQSHVRAGASRTLYFELVAKVMVKLLQGFNEKKVHRKPDGAAPIRVATEQAGRRLCRLISHRVLTAVDGQHVRLVFVGTGKRTDAMGSQELRFIQHERQDPS